MAQRYISIAWTCVVFWEQPLCLACPDFLYIDGDTGDIGPGVWIGSDDVAQVTLSAQFMSAKI